MGHIPVPPRKKRILMALLPGADKKCLLLVVVNAESPVRVKTKFRGKAVKGLCLLLAECPLAAENNLSFHNQLGKKTPLDSISEVTDVGHMFSMVSVRDSHSTLHYTGNIFLNIMTFFNHAQIRVILLCSTFLIRLTN